MDECLTVITRSIDSPLGSLEVFLDVGGTEPALSGLSFWGAKWSGPSTRGELSSDAQDLLDELVFSLAGYFSGSRREFKVAMRPRGTKFQREVWAQLVQIPIGETISYGELARRVGRPGGARAVGQANKCNPIPILIPCHRVIGADGSIGGYSGGLDRKEFLLELEGVDRPRAIGGLA